MVKSASHLVQILLPLSTGGGKAVERHIFDDLLDELTERFGGVTSFKQSPGEGHWDSGRRIEQDSVALIEVVTDELEYEYFLALKTRLEEQQFQDEIMIRALAITTF